MISSTNGINRTGGFFKAIGDFFGGAAQPAAAPADDLSGLLDDWAALRRPADLAPAARQAIARLGVPGGAAAVDAAGWAALADAWLTASPSERAGLASQIGGADVTAAVSRDGRYVTFRDATLTVMAEPDADRLRVQRADRADCYQDGRLVETMSITPQEITVDTAYGTEVWKPDGTGTLDGRPVVPRAAARVPGEPPRRTIAAPPPNELDEPDWQGQSWMKLYGPEYDEAIVEAGGEIVEPYQATGDADVYNCHAYATTGAGGDLFDPYLRAGQPHWLDNPSRQLAGADFGRLAPDQRVHVGDVVVYKKDGQITHTGVVAAVDRDGNPSQVESKFGTLGLYIHDTYDVSALYGQPAEFYRPQ